MKTVTMYIKATLILAPVIICLSSNNIVMEVAAALYAAFLVWLPTYSDNAKSFLKKLYKRVLEIENTLK